VPVGMKGSIFISYRREEAGAFAGRLAFMLDRDGYEVFIDVGIHALINSSRRTSHRCSAETDRPQNRPTRTCGRLSHANNISSSTGNDEFLKQDHPNVVIDSMSSRTPSTSFECSGSSSS
jgi:hypothetical protein